MPQLLPTVNISLEDHPRLQLSLEMVDSIDHLLLSEISHLSILVQRLEEEVVPVLSGVE
jgi:hypothetical protein